ncbi:hypothetical protein BGZ76_005090 [Entomortierella beljakovae]|nr:hypothetical protein BGZ76_005090 [Entomortierella beljakovae]
MSSTPMSTQALRVGAIALIVIALWYWNTSKPSGKEDDDKKSSKSTTTTTTTTTTSSKDPKGTSTTTTETVVHGEAIESGKKDAIEETVVTDITTADIKIVPENVHDDEEEEEEVTVQITSREISAEPPISNIQEYSIVKTEVTETEVVESTSESLLTSSEIQLTESYVEDMTMTESELVEHAQEIPEEKEEEVVEQQQQRQVELAESAVITPEADISYEDDYEDELEEIEEGDDEFESVLVFTVTSPANSKRSEKNHQEQKQPEFVERDIFASKPETIQTPTKDASEVTLEGSDQADTPTTLVGEELELTEDTLQTLQEVSRVAKHSELNAKAMEFKPSWLSSSQQEHVTPSTQPDSPKQITKLKSRCHYWPNCTNKACKYTHPAQPCRDGDQCRFGERCIFIHPKDQNAATRTKKAAAAKQSAAAGGAPSSHGRRTSSATMTSVSPVEPWGRV